MAMLESPSVAELERLGDLLCRLAGYQLGVLFRRMAHLGLSEDERDDLQAAAQAAVLEWLTSDDLIQAFSNYVQRRLYRAARQMGFKRAYVRRGRVGGWVREAWPWRGDR